VTPEGNVSRKASAGWQRSPRVERTSKISWCGVGLASGGLIVIYALRWRLIGGGLFVLGAITLAADAVVDRLGDMRRTIDAASKRRPR
jgi:hypothetical protein